MNNFTDTIICLPMTKEVKDKILKKLDSVELKDRIDFIDSIIFEENLFAFPDDEEFIDSLRIMTNLKLSNENGTLKFENKKLPEEEIITPKKPLEYFDELEIKDILKESGKKEVSNYALSIYTKWILKKFNIKPYFGDRGIINIDIKAEDGEFENWELELRKITYRIFGEKYSDFLIKKVFAILIASDKSLTKVDLLKERGEFEDDFIILSSKDISESEFERKFIVDNFIHEGSVNVLYSPPANYKSFLALDMALSVATGNKWLERETKKSNVLYWDLENPKFVIKERQEALKAGKDIEGSVEGLSFLNSGMLMDREKTINTTLLRKVKKQIKDNEVKLIIVDTMHRLANYDENSANDFNMFYTGILKPIARDLNCAFLLLHHSNKNGDYRGSSDIEGAVECMFEMKKIKEEGLFEIKSKKFRFGKEQKIKGKIEFEDESISINKIDFNTEQENEEAEKITTVEAIKNLFVRENQIKRSEIIKKIEQLDISDIYVDKILKQLVKQKYLEKGKQGLYNVNTNNSSYKFLLKRTIDNPRTLLDFLKKNQERIVSINEIQDNVFPVSKEELNKLKEDGVIDEPKPNHFQYLG